jgi:hypothetical protein
MDKEQFVESAQFNYLHDLEWLIGKYPIENQDKPLTIISGHPLEHENRHLLEAYPNIKFIRVK